MSSATLTAVALAGSNGPLRPDPRSREGTSRSRGALRRRGGLVLTRRGRRLLRALSWLTVTVGLALGLVLLWVTVAASVAPGAAAGDGGRGTTSVSGDAGPIDTVEVVVGPGDTLWQIARERSPERDPRAVVADVVRLNELSSAGVQAGQTVLVPVD